MINREQIEAILKINGVAPSSPDDQIRSVLLSARYSKDEVDTAIMVLREDVKTNEAHVDGLHKVFRTNDALKSEEISRLLGIDVTLEDEVVPQSRHRTMSTMQHVLVWTLSVVVAIMGVLFYMYLHRVGIFHPSVYMG